MKKRIESCRTAEVGNKAVLYDVGNKRKIE